jgi:hypothetical protein
VVVETPPTGVELEVVVQPLAQSQVDEYDEVELELEVVDEETGLAGVESQELEVVEYELVQVELVVDGVVLVVDVVGVVVGPYGVGLEVVVVVLDVPLPEVAAPAQEQPVNSGLIFCA